MIEARGKAREFAGDRRAATAVEFAIIASVYLLFLLAIMGVGVSGYFQLVLDDAVRDAARQVQIGGPASNSGTSFVTAVCNEFGLVAMNCTAKLTYNVQANAPPANFSAMQPIAMPASGNLPNVFPAIAGNNNVVVQAAFPLPILVPYVGAAMTFTGTNSIMATTTIRTEPR